MSSAKIKEVTLNPVSPYTGIKKKKTNEQYNSNCEHFNISEEHAAGGAVS
jgi:hypothetical protein